MNKRKLPVLCILGFTILLQIEVAAQRTVQRDGMTRRSFPGDFDDGPRAVRQIPPPLVAGPELEMRETPIHFEPTGFLLKTQQGGTFGPFRFEDGTTIGSALHAYTLKRVGPPEVAGFTLTATHSGVVFGPFTARTGSTLAFDQDTISLAVERLPPSLDVTLTHSRALPLAPTIALGPLTEECRRGLYTLRDALVARANFLAAETAPTEIEGLPTITSRYGTRHEPVIQRSLRDRQTALAAADRAAAALVDAFVRRHLPHRVPPDADTVRHFRPLTPGPWLLCAIIPVKNPDAKQPAPSLTAYWWAPFDLAPETAATLTLTDANACAWQDLFLFP